MDEFIVSKDTVQEELSEVHKSFDALSHEVLKEKGVYEKMEKKLNDLAAQ